MTWLPSKSQVICTIATIAVAIVQYFVPQFMFDVGYLYFFVVCAWTYYSGFKSSLAVIACILLYSLYLDIDNVFFLSDYIIIDKISRLISYTFASYLISKQRNTNIDLRQNINIDHLTGLVNRKGFYDRSTELLKNGESYFILFIDIDNFKTINDTFGHAAGDRLLIIIADVFRRKTRRSDIVSRFGGDEFVILLTNLTFSDAERLVYQLKASLDMTVHKYKFDVTFSIGAMFMEHGDTELDAVISASDKLMYEVKNNGKNSIYVVDSGKTDSVLRN